MPSLASSPGISIATETLATVHETLGAIAVDGERELWDVLGSDEPNVAVSFEVVLPTSLAGPAGKALRSIDLAWRLAFVVTEREIDELALESADEAHLDQIAPVEDTGLLVDMVDIGSIRATIKSQGTVSVKRLAAVLSIMASLSQVTDVNLQQVAHAQKTGRPPIEIKLGDPRLESVSDAIRHELPGLPSGAEVTISGETPDGSTFTATFTAPD
jgi:hypothetical protein